MFPTNDQKLEAIALECDGKGDVVTLVARFDGTEQRIACGRGAWQKGRSAFGTFTEQSVAASGAWTGDDTYVAKLCFYEMPFYLRVTLKFSGDQLRYDSESNVAFGPTRKPQLVGRTE